MAETEQLREVNEPGKHFDVPQQGVAAGTAPLSTALGRTAQIEKLIGVTLLAGVLASACIVFLGGTIYVFRHPHSRVHYRVFRGEPSDLRSLPGIWEDLQIFSGRGIIQLGLMVLVGLQVTRVALTGALFLTGRDWVFVSITGVILALLAYGLFFESAGGH